MLNETQQNILNPGLYTATLFYRLQRFGFQNPPGNKEVPGQLCQYSNYNILSVEYK